MGHDIIGSIFFIVFAMVMSFEAFRLGLGTFHRPGPGFIPLLTALSIAVLSSIYLISQRIRKDKRKKAMNIVPGPYWLRSFYIAAFSLIYMIFLWNKLGFIISTTLWLGFCFWLGGVKSWKKSLIVAMGIAILSYFLLEKVTHSFLPKGILKF